MKIARLLSLFFLAFVLLLAGCGKDDDPNPNDFIIGTWTVSDVTVDMKVGTKTLVEYFVSMGLSQTEAQLLASQFSDGFEGDFSGEIEFKKDGTYTSKDGSDTNTGKWELSSDGKTLTTDKGTADEMVLTVASHTATKMNLTSEFTEEESGETLKITMDIEMTKK
jgi:hypothetical protein